jgi:hypothetical protein
MCLAIELRKLHFYRGCGISGWDLELEVKLIANKIVNVPALSIPSIPSVMPNNLLGPISIGFNVKPVIILILIHLNVLNQEHVLFLKPLNPSLAAIFRSRISL